MNPKHAGCLGVVTVHIPCEFGYLRIARQNVRDFSARAGLNEMKAAQLEMALDEACTNIIEHSYGLQVSDPPGTEDRGIHLTFLHFDDRVEVEMVDYGRGFSYEDTPEIPPEDYVAAGRRRGLGLFIIRNFVDDVDYASDVEQGNTLRLTKKL